MATSITLITILSALSLGNANFFDRGSLDTPLAPTAMDMTAGQTISKGQNQRRRLQATADDLPADPTARISGVLYNGQSSSVSTMPASAAVGGITVQAGSGAGTFTEVGSGGYFTFPKGSYFEMDEVIGRDTWTMYFLFNIGTQTSFEFAGADPGGYGNLDSEIGFGACNNNFIIDGMQNGEMLASTHWSGGVNNGVHTDGKTWNDNDWHWVEFESSMDVARYSLTFEDGSTYAETNVNAGFGRDDVKFRVFCGQGCSQDGTMKVSEAIVYNRILTDAEKAATRAYLSSGLSNGEVVEVTADPTREPTADPTASPSADPSTSPTTSSPTTAEPTTANPTDACYGVQCVDLFTCDVESDQFDTVTDYPCKRDCDLFGFDEYLDQCSAIFPSAVEAVMASIGEVNESVQRITDSDIPAVTARVQINEDAVADINNELSTMHLLVGELSNVDAAMNESIADLVTDINEDLSSVISLISALSDVDTTLNNSIAAVTVLAESALIALEERVAFLEVRLENFGASSAAKTADEHMYAAGDSIALSGSLFAKYKDEILGALVAANFFVMVACACMISSRNNKKFKYVSVVGDEEAGTENE